MQTISNLKLITHGLFSRFGNTANVDPVRNPYLGAEDQNIYYYKGLFPQALRHFSAGVNITF